MCVENAAQNTPDHTTNSANLPNLQKPLGYVGKKLYLVLVVPCLVLKQELENKRCKILSKWQV